MNTVIAKEELERILDQAVQDVTERTAGVHLHQGEQSPGEDLCTVQITFDKVICKQQSLSSFETI